MISHFDLSKVSVKNIIFHDVPVNAKNAIVQPVLTDEETVADAKRVPLLETRIRGVLGGGAAYPIEFQPGSASPVPQAVRLLTDPNAAADCLILESRKMASFLFDLQVGTVSAGLLCVLKVTAGLRRGVAIMKLDRERGADLHLTGTSGHRAFEMAVLDSLVLTDGTRLFKSALFLEGPAGSIEAAASDNQNSVNRSSDVAQFWLKFLGCKFVVDPRISTQQWFDASVAFVNDIVADPVQKNVLYAHLVSEMKSNRASVAPKKFITDCVKTELQQEYSDFLKDRNVSLQRFPKDTADIDAKLNRLSYHTKEGVTVSAPAGKENLIEVGNRRIVVNDALEKISRK
jgi:37-kD nucleoid-associated bacterial protein